MRKIMVWVLGLFGALAISAAAQDITGNWQGTLDIGKGVRMVIKISKDDGQLKGMLYNADQPARPLAIDGLALKESTVTFEIKQMSASYSGTLNAEHTLVTGNVTLGGQAHKLDLQHVTSDNTWPIPEPAKPMPADAKPKFDVVTVKPGVPNSPGKLFTVRGRHILTINTTLNDMISFGYNLHPKQVVGLPDWAATEKFDLDGVPDVEGQPNTTQFKALIADALVQRFGLKFHDGKRELSVYVLTVAKDGPKMKQTSDKPSDLKNFIFGKLGDLRVTNSSMKDFCDGMQSAVMDRPVVDQTGLTDRYDFRLTWTPDDTQFGAFGVHIPPPNPDDPNPAPGLYTALQEQLGLKMEATKAMADAMVIDHVEKPSAN